MSHHPLPPFNVLFSFMSHSLSVPHFTLSHDSLALPFIFQAPLSPVLFLSCPTKMSSSSGHFWPSLQGVHLSFPISALFFTPAPPLVPGQPSSARLGPGSGAGNLTMAEL